ncbi:MAG: hypothetical protein GX814_09015 [Microbacteriaceae bacterium]|nr:hypothetical protein [Microbacteriaceae bacterium]
MASPKHPAFGASPRADLLTDAQRAEIHHEQTLPKLLLALIACGVVAGLIWAAGMIPVTLAQQEHAALQTRSAELSTQIAGYDETGKLLQAVGSREIDRQTVTADEVLFMEVRDDIKSKLPEGATIVKFTGTTVAADSAAPEPDEDCVAMGAVATLVIASSDANARGLGATFIDSMEDIEGFLCGQVVDSQPVDEGGARTLNTQIRVTFDETVLSGRFAEEDAS